jgi:hypothetical protein
MSPRSARETLKVEIDSLPEELAEEVLDFIGFMRQRRDEESFLCHEARAAEERMAASPDDVQTLTRAEWEALTDHPGA